MKGLTFKKLKEIIEEHQIREDVILESDSGWECDPTYLGDVLFSAEENRMIFLQPEGTKYKDEEFIDTRYPGFKLIYSFVEEENEVNS